MSEGRGAAAGNQQRRGPSRYRSRAYFSHGTDDPDYMRMVQDIEDSQQRHGWLFGRGALDKGDMLYLRDEQQRQQDSELRIRDGERSSYVEMRSRLARSASAARSDPGSAALPNAEAVKLRAPSAAGQHHMEGGLPLPRVRAAGSTAAAPRLDRPGERRKAAAAKPAPDLAQPPHSAKRRRTAAWETGVMEGLVGRGYGSDDDLPAAVLPSAEELFQDRDARASAAAAESGSSGDSDGDGSSTSSGGDYGRYDSSCGFGLTGCALPPAEAGRVDGEGAAAGQPLGARSGSNEAQGDMERSQTEADPLDEPQHKNGQPATEGCKASDSPQAPVGGRSCSKQWESDADSDHLPGFGETYFLMTGEDGEW